MILSITGQIGSGKDLIAKMIQYYLSMKSENKNFNKKSYYLESHLKNPADLSFYSGFEIKKFAYKLKQIAALITGFNVENYESQSFKEGTYLQLPEWKCESGNFSKNQRQVLQDIGVGMRNVLHKDVWINALFSDYKPIDYIGIDPTSNFVYPNWIISDLRFLNEAAAIKSRDGIIIKVVRNTEIVGGSHISETELNEIQYDYLIENNGTIEELYQKVSNVIELIFYVPKQNDVMIAAPKFVKK